MQRSVGTSTPIIIDALLKISPVEVNSDPAVAEACKARLTPCHAPALILA